jgi:hypothetical protein
VFVPASTVADCRTIVLMDDHRLSVTECGTHDAVVVRCCLLLLLNVWVNERTEADICSLTVVVKKRSFDPGRYGDFTTECKVIFTHSSRVDSAN